SLMLVLSFSFFFFFFFQAEDGIRDRNVTGVQTCALPIFSCIKRYAMYLENIFIKRVRLLPHTGCVLTLRIFRKLLTKNLLRLNKSAIKKKGRSEQRTNNRRLKMKQKNSGLWHFLVRSTEIQYASFR